MTAEIGFVLALIAVAVFLFATEKLRVDVIALLVLLTLGLTGLVGPDQIFAGFANPAVITVWAVYIVSGGLFRVGLADRLGAQITRLAGQSEARLVAVIMITCGTMSAFMNNIGAVAVLLPAVAGISRESKIPLSRLLIPLSFASLMGGNMTLIGTPPNVLAASILSERGLASLQFFDFTPMGVLVFASGVIYMVFFGRHLLPRREAVEDRPEAYALRDYISEVRILPGSVLAGKSLLEARLGADYDLSILSVVHEGQGEERATRDTTLREGDLLMVQGVLQNLFESKEKLGIAIEAEHKVELAHAGNDIGIFDAVVAPRSPIVGRTLREIRFREQYGFTVLAIWRKGGPISGRLRDVRLEFGDTLILQGPGANIAALQEADEFLALAPIAIQTRRRKKAPIALAIMALVLLLTTLFGYHISLAMLIGAVLMVLTGCLTMDEAYQSIEWRSIFLIAGMLPLGLAMETTGTARYLADGLVGIVGAWGPLAVLAGIYLLASMITEPMSNAAATVLIVPIAIDVALGLGVSPQTFVLATVIGASTSFLTPVGHQANVLVFGPAGYRFFDYTRVGMPLNIVLFVVTMIFLPLLWPL